MRGAQKQSSPDSLEDLLCVCSSSCSAYDLFNDGVVHALFRHKLGAIPMHLSQRAIPLSSINVTENCNLATLSGRADCWNRVVLLGNAQTRRSKPQPSLIAKPAKRQIRKKCSEDQQNADYEKEAVTALSERNSADIMPNSPATRLMGNAKTVTSVKTNNVRFVCSLVSAAHSS
jgi:hypothetical protein